MVLLLSGCGKKFWDYNCTWVSEEPYVYIPLEQTKAVIEIDGEKVDVETGWENDGTKIYFYEKGNKVHEDEDLIWVASVKLKSGKMYLTITEDYYGDEEGKEFVLQQRPRDEDEGE